jgi:hypothetical protein
VKTFCLGRQCRENNGLREPLRTATGVQFVSVPSDQRENDQRETVFGISAGIKNTAFLTGFDEPIALALDSTSTLYVLDDIEHRVRKIQ